LASRGPERRDLAVAVAKVKEVFGLFNESYEE
jgi:hypothetical protein